MRLDLHHNIDITFGESRSQIAKSKLAKLKRYGVLVEIVKFNAHQIFLLYGIQRHAHTPELERQSHAL